MPLDETLKMLAGFEPTELPVISLYLNTQPDQHGRANFEPFVRKELKARARTFPLRSPARLSFEADAERIERYLREELQPSSNGLCLFACHGAEGFFHAVQTDAPVEEHRLYVYRQPHLYPLARLQDQHPRYAALVADTNHARLYVFGTGATLGAESVSNTNVNKTRLGGWSQARYQRHIENYHLHHAKEIVETLDRIVCEEEIDKILLAGDEVIIPVLREQLPARLNRRVVDVLRLDITTPEHEIASRTLDALREHDAELDKQKIESLADELHAGGLAIAGAHDTLAALANGQVDELFVSAQLEAVHDGGEEVGRLLLADSNDDRAAASDNGETLVVKIADELVTRAKQTGAGVTFVEDPALLADAGGVAATLRYRL